MCIVVVIGAVVSGRRHEQDPGISGVIDRGCQSRISGAAEVSPAGIHHADVHERGIVEYSHSGGRIAVTVVVGEELQRYEHRIGRDTGDAGVVVANRTDNTRDVTDLERAWSALKGIEGKRLTYRQPGRP